MAKTREPTNCALPSSATVRSGPVSHTSPGKPEPPDARAYRRANGGPGGGLEDREPRREAPREPRTPQRSRRPYHAAFPGPSAGQRLADCCRCFVICPRSWPPPISGANQNSREPNGEPTEADSGRRRGERRPATMSSAGRHFKRHQATSSDGSVAPDKRGVRKFKSYCAHQIVPDRGQFGGWQKKPWVAAGSLGHKGGKRVRPKVFGRTKTEVKAKLRELRRDMENGFRPSAIYTVGTTGWPTG